MMAVVGWGGVGGVTEEGNGIVIASSRPIVPVPETSSFPIAVPNFRLGISLSNYIPWPDYNPPPPPYYQ